MNKKLIIGVVAVLIIAGISIYASSNNTNNDLAMIQKEKIEKEAMEKDQMLKDEDMKKDETGMVDNGIDKSDTIMKTGSYEEYSPEKIARADVGKVVLFFHASWCPSCRGLNSDIEKNIGSIPEGLSILKVDYDKETELKKKYGITYQHTLVQIDKDGNLIKKWSGSPKLENIISEIK